MAQSGSARKLLYGEGVYSYTSYQEAEHGIIWMNLQDYGGHEIRAVPVQFVEKQSKEFRQKYFKNRKTNQSNFNRIFACVNLDQQTAKER